MPSPSTVTTTPAAGEDRRGFVTKMLAIVFGVVCGVVPFAAGVVTFMDPTRRRGTGASFVKVADLDALPADGVPRKFEVLGTVVNAWNKFVKPLGAVYLRRSKDGEVSCLSATCPHAGCFVDFAGTEFKCPCHNSTFEFDGSRILVGGKEPPSPRDMDTLAVKVDSNNVYVEYRDFVGGQHDKIPVE